jgi:tetratricopeptide (TPR) repeat protein
MEGQKIFFSYSRADGEKYALQLAQDLRDAGANIWMDQLDISPGKVWDIEIENALETSACVLFIATAKSTTSNNVLNEVYYALEEDKEVIPIIFEECRIPFRLKRLQHINFINDYEKGFKRLVQALQLNNASSNQTIKAFHAEHTSVPAEEKEKNKAATELDKEEINQPTDKQQAEIVHPTNKWPDQQEAITIVAAGPEPYAVDEENNSRKNYVWKICLGVGALFLLLVAIYYFTANNDSKIASNTYPTGNVPFDSANVITESSKDNGTKNSKPETSKKEVPPKKTDQSGKTKGRQPSQSIVSGAVKPDPNAFLTDPPSKNHDPGDFKKLVGAGKASMDKKDPESALVYLRKALETGQKSEELFSLLGDVYLSLGLRYRHSGQEDKASNKYIHTGIAYLNDAIKLNPKYARYHFMQGHAYSALHDSKTAIYCYSKAIELNPNESGYYMYRGRARESIKDIKGACIDFRTAAELGNEYGKNLYGKMGCKE